MEFPPASTPRSAGFANTYINFPEKFRQNIQPAPVPQPRLIRFNSELAEDLGLRLQGLSEAELADYFSGNVLFADAEPIAMAYAGHQFGSFVNQLGDGRAVLLGEITTDEGKRYDLQLKGSGRTKWSRGGDGKSPLGPVIREYIVSEAMHALGVPTTRALAMVATGEEVWRRTGALPGGILTRISSGYLRVGSFEYFLARNDWEAIRVLADYAIDRHYPGAAADDNPYLGLFQRVCATQANLVARWMQLGFIHGVMNTDNTSICGETLDYGPCAFMDEYHPDTVFSSIDVYGRYRYANQGNIMLWNLSSLGNCLSHLMGEDEEAVGDRQAGILEHTRQQFLQEWYDGMRRKFGLRRTEDGDVEIIKGYLDILRNQRTDYTLAFRYLADNVGRNMLSERFSALFKHPEELAPWIERWQQRLLREGTARGAVASLMNRENPAYIPRNHRVEQAIQLAEQENSFTEVHRLLEILHTPYAEHSETTAYMLQPTPEERVVRTFCGT